MRVDSQRKCEAFPFEPRRPDWSKKQLENYKHSTSLKPTTVNGKESNEGQIVEVGEEIEIAWGQ